MMTCSEMMYQPGLSSCFTSFNSNPYSSINPYQSSGYPGTSDLMKKHASAKPFADRYFVGNSSDASHSGYVQDLSTQGSARYQARSASSAFVGTQSFIKIEDKSGDEKPLPVSRQYLAPNATLSIYHNGDASSAVEDHFSKALNPAVTSSAKGTLHSRNLPASFWNPNPVPMAPSQPAAQSYPGLPYHGFPSTSTDYGYDFYQSSFHTPGFSADSALHYSAAAQNYSRAAAFQATAAAGFSNSDRFSSAYSNPMMFRTGPCKAPGWTNSGLFGSEMPQYSQFGTDYDSSSKPGTSKEHYWH